MKLREYFVRKENKNDLIQQFLLYNFYLSVFDVHSRQYHKTFVCIPVIVNKVQHMHILRQNAGSCISSITHKRGTVVKARWKIIRKFSDFIKNILICVPKMNEGLTGLERHEWVINDRIFIFESTIPLN